MAKKTLPKPVRVEGASFNKEYWADKSKEQFMEANQGTYSKILKDHEDPQGTSEKLLAEACSKIAPTPVKEIAPAKSKDK